MRPWACPRSRGMGAWHTAPPPPTSRTHTMRPNPSFAPRLRGLARCCALAACTAGLLAAAPLHAQNGGPSGAALSPQVSRDSAAPRTVAMVHQGIFNYVRIERAEDGAAPNLHPLDITEEDLARMLGTVRLGTKPLLDKGDLDEIVPHLAAALDKATAQQDVSFAVAGKHTAFGLFAARDVTTGRLFNTADGLQLIVGLAHQPFEDQFKARGTLIPFEPGRRAAPLAGAVTLKLAASAGTMQRADWVVLRPAATAQVPAQVGMPPAAAKVAPAPAAAAAAVSPVQPAASATPADARFREISERLKTLERLRDSGLITPQEYEQKRKQVLDGL